VNAKATYHHGNLRRALLDESLAVIGEEGVEALSLRDVAARVGVSHAAPYHHFADKSALIHAIAHEGMAKMHDAMEAAEAATDDDAERRLVAIGMAYVRFAVEHADYYAAFTAPEMTELAAEAEQPPAASGDTWGRLMGAVVEGQRSGVLPTGDPMVLAVYLWSLVHGLAELWRTGPLSKLPQASGGLEPLAGEVLRAALGSLETEAHAEGTNGQGRGDAAR
jgi:AcrR family transcriptional regulator